jgi:hypothetical protein
MDASIEELKAELNSKWALMGLKRSDGDADKLVEMVNNSTFEGGRGGPKTRENLMVLKPQIVS